MIYAFILYISSFKSIPITWLYLLLYMCTEDIKDVLNYYCRKYTYLSSYLANVSVYFLNRCSCPPVSESKKENRAKQNKNCIYNEYLLNVAFKLSLAAARNFASIASFAI